MGPQFGDGRQVVLTSAAGMLADVQPRFVGVFVIVSRPGRAGRAMANLVLAQNDEVGVGDGHNASSGGLAVRMKYRAVPFKPRGVRDNASAREAWRMPAHGGAFGLHTMASVTAG